MYGQNRDLTGHISCYIMTIISSTGSNKSKSRQGSYIDIFISFVMLDASLTAIYCCSTDIKRQCHNRDRVAQTKEKYFAP